MPLFRDDVASDVRNDRRARVAGSSVVRGNALHQLRTVGDGEPFRTVTETNADRGGCPGASDATPDDEGVGSNAGRTWSM